MDDMISRQAAIEAINKALDRQTLLNRFVRKVAIDAIKQLPPAQPERIKGRWVPAGGALYQCDQCGVVSLKRKFCSECGADMRER